jgi:peptidoglycan/LPS O-acetylase OafA/YrhL
LRNQRYEAVDALRGAAALVVAIEHSFSTFLTDWRTPLLWSHGGKPWPDGAASVVDFIAMQVFNGSAAVLVFFVISGFVLGEALRAEERSVAGYLRYATKRGFRIIPAMWVSVFAASVVTAASDIWRHLFFMDSAMNPPLWSMRVEIVLCLLLPFVVWMPPGKIWTLCYLPMLAFFVWLAKHPPQDALLFQYALFFWLGVGIPRTRGIFQRLSAALTTAAALVCVALICISRGLANHLSPSYHEFVYLNAVPAFVLVAYCAYGTGTLKELLMWPSLQHVGRISYSFYVYHFVLLMLIVHVLQRAFGANYFAGNPLPGQLIVLATSIPLTLVLARWSYLVIELPMIDLGRKLTAPARWAIRTAMSAGESRRG